MLVGAGQKLLLQPHRADDCRDDRRPVPDGTANLKRFPLRILHEQHAISAVIHLLDGGRADSIDVSVMAKQIQPVGLVVVMRERMDLYLSSSVLCRKPNGTER